MVNTCCIPNCKGNYPNGPIVSVFSFPKCPELKEKWLAKIPRDFEPSPHSKVCELHFADAAIRRTTQAFDEKTMKTIEIKLKQPRLQKDAVPTIFPNCPKYLSSIPAVREPVRQHQTEQRHIEAAIAESIKYQKEYESRYNFNSFSDCLKCINNSEIPDGWIFVHKENNVYFHFVTYSPPTAEMVFSVNINSDLQMTAFTKDIPINVVNKIGLPLSIKSVHGIFYVLNYLKLNINVPTDNLESCINSTKHCLNNLKNLVNEEKKSASISSKYKDVVHILPVKKITADILFHYIKKIICGLEEIGIHIFCIITDNNAINQKAVSCFADPPKSSIVYRHPMSNEKPLFFMLDTVHLIKSIRNNWLNQKNEGKCMFYPPFASNMAGANKDKLKTASLQVLRKLQQIDSPNLIHYGYSLTLKSLNPSNLERQNVKFVLQIFNAFVVEERPFKGHNKRNEFQKPLRIDDKRMQFLYTFLNWLDVWESYTCVTGTLTRETHQALKHTTYAVIEITHYCIEELKLDYVLTGKLQTDSLEDRFGKYRRLAGANYNVSITQIFESENKLRLQSISFILTTLFSLLEINNSNYEEPLDESEIALWLKLISVEENDFQNIQSLLPALIYVAGYCLYAANKKIKCSECYQIMAIDNTIDICEKYVFIRNLDRGNLKYPSEEVIQIVIYNYIIITKLLSPDHKVDFCEVQNQRSLVFKITSAILSSKEIYLESVNCPSSHSSEFLSSKIIWPSTNILLKNFCRKKMMKFKKLQAKKTT
ncbi:LOW QUALITY PROTEIN: uncharacterized protein LOC118190813 [Stegodyphus dumicola]|uniref:LOW QUALITY PROTEIN: uncharacterized protein LOC118190813 n=1 Tax=Stegodyphus dumicola TaxID=202533 RepID=UPI0015B19F44|nr:LOW QUALITY PROTEIN: uncharacterized protein LOC118190813 [Stegodyphus dumicola]